MVPNAMVAKPELCHSWETGRVNRATSHFEIVSMTSRPRCTLSSNPSGSNRLHDTL